MAEINKKGELTIDKKDGLLYAFAGMGCNGPASNFINYFFLFFMTDVAGIPTLLAASCYTIADTVKAVHMMLSGVMVDAVKFKNEKYRPWFTTCAFVTLFVAGGIFIPWNISNVYVYAALITTLQCIATFSYNVNWTAHRSLVGVMSNNSNDNVTLVSWANAAAMTSGLVYALGNKYMLSAWAGAGKFQHTGAEYTWAAISCIGSLLLATLAKKYDPKALEAAKNSQGAKKERVGLLEMLKTLTGPGLVYFIAGCLQSVPSGFFTSLLAYFTTYVLKNPTAMGYAVAVNYIGGIIGAIITPMYSKKWTRKRLMVFGLVALAVLYFAMFFVGRTGLGFLATRLLIGIFNQPGSIALTAIANDLGDYYEMKGESRARSFVQAVCGTTIRIGGLISAAVSSFGLAILGYEKGMEMTEDMINKICWLMALAPSICCVIVALIYAFFYHMDEEALDAYRHQRAEAQK